MSAFSSAQNAYFLENTAGKCGSSHLTCSPHVPTPPPPQAPPKTSRPPAGVGIRRILTEESLLISNTETSSPRENGGTNGVGVVPALGSQGPRWALPGHEASWSRLRGGSPTLHTTSLNLAGHRGLASSRLISFLL